MGKSKDISAAANAASADYDGCCQRDLRGKKEKH
jgi:hypothetical protein